MRAFPCAPPMPMALAAFVAAMGSALVVGPIHGHAKPPTLRGTGTARVVSVDGPARLTIKTKGRTLKMRLIGVDTPQVGECGAAESIAALRRIVAAKKGKRLRYTLAEQAGGPFTRDADGRWLGWVSPGRSPMWERSLATELVATEWARGGDAVAAGATPQELSDWSSTFTGFGPSGERAPRGVWAKCGGRMHLPVGAPVPSSEPAQWTISAEGVTEAIGPLALSPLLSPATTLTVNRVAAIAPVELTRNGNQGGCEAAVPSLQITLLTTSSPKVGGCSAADVYAISTSGPGRLTTSRGITGASTTEEAVAAFPRLDGEVEDTLFLSGPSPVAWAWRTTATLDEGTGRIYELRTTTGPNDDA